LEVVIDMKRPFGIALIGYFYIFGAIILLLTLVIKQEIGINARHFYENDKYSLEKTNQGN
jgi:hypothetical protein